VDEEVPGELPGDQRRLESPPGDDGLEVPEFIPPG
jgi:hypothetical protein